MNSQLQNTNIETYSTNNEKNYLIPERFIRTLKLFYKYKTSVVVYNNKLDDVIDRYKKTSQLKQNETC